VERRGWVDGVRSRILRVDERRADGSELRRWYDDDGRLVAAAAGAWSATLSPAREQGAVDPAQRALALQVADASEALFGAPRGCEP
jgi:hypothetical protein